MVLLLLVPELADGGDELLVLLLPGPGQAPDLVVVVLGDGGLQGGRGDV